MPTLLSDTNLELGESPMNFYQSRYTKVTDLTKVSIKGGSATKDITQNPTALWIGKS